MTTATQNPAARENVADHEQKRRALGYLQEAWAEAHHDGIEGDCLAQTALFLALAELISTYGEEPPPATRKGSRRAFATANFPWNCRGNSTNPPSDFPLAVPALVAGICVCVLRLYARCGLSARSP